LRVVSLVPSVTETLLAWGIEPVACTRFCEQPDLPHVGGTKDPDLASIIGLAPDLVVLDREENRKEDADALASAGLLLHVTHVVHLADVEPTLRALWEAVGTPDVDPWPASEVPPVQHTRRRAFVPIWRRPWMTISDDTYGSTVLQACGIHNVFAGHPDRYPEVTLDEARDARPDLVILPSEPYAFTDRHIPEASTVAPDVRMLDGRDLFWWGVRTPGALVRITAALA
jgi:hypothetical protein